VRRSAHTHDACAKNTQTCTEARSFRKLVPRSALSASLPQERRHRLAPRGVAALPRWTRPMFSIHAPRAPPILYTACPASRPSQGAHGSRPACVPNRHQAPRRPWHARMQRPLEPSTRRALSGRGRVQRRTEDAQCSAERCQACPARWCSGLRARRGCALAHHPSPRACAPPSAGHCLSCFCTGTT